MKIVINIPKDVRDRVVFGITYRQDLQIIGEAIANGTPLPEHHGRLIDANALRADSFCVDGEELLSINDLIIAPTIVEADKEGEDDRD